MSCSKHQVGVVVDKAPKCARCRNHGHLVPQKGHTRFCTFLDCACWKCSLVTDRSKIMARQRQMRGSEKKMNNSGPGGTEEPRRPPPPMEEAGSPGTSYQFSSAAARVLVLEDEKTAADHKTYAQLHNVRPREVKDPPEEEERFPGPSRIRGPDLHRGASPGPPPHEFGLDRDRDHLEAIRSHCFIRPQELEGSLGMNRSRLHVSYLHELGQREVSPAAMPMMPMVVWDRCPNGCIPCPGILVNMPPRPPCPHGPFYISHFQSTMDYPSASPDGSGLFFATQPPAAFRAPYQEDWGQTHVPL